MIHVPGGEDLVAEDPVVFKADTADIKCGVVQIRGHVGPVEDGNIAEENERVATGGQSLVFDHRLARGGVDFGLAGKGVHKRPLNVFEMDVAHLQAIAGLAHAAGCYERVLGEEMILARLTQDFALQPQYALKLRRRG